jgi:PAS domain S-box-containing protein
MDRAPSPLLAPQRLSVLHATGLLDSPPEQVYAGLTQAARCALEVPFAFINLVGDDRVYVKSVDAEEGDAASLPRELPYSATLCPLVVERGSPLAVRDAAEEPWSVRAPDLAGRGFRAYAGEPIRVAGEIVGTVCGVDRLPREWRRRDMDVLAAFAVAVAGVMELQTHHRAGETPSASLLESITDGFFALDGEWRFTYVNGEAERLLGTTRSELLGSEIWSLYPELVGSPFHAEYLKAVREQVPVAFEAPSVVRPGRWLEVKANPMPGGLAVYFHDITARRRADETLRFLADASRELSGSLDYETTLSNVSRLAVPLLADYCFIDILEEDGAVRRVAAAHRDARYEPVVRKLQEFPTDLRSDRPSARVLRTGRSVVSADVGWPPPGTEDAPAELLEIVRTLGLTAYLAVPLRARSHTLGTLFCARSSVGAGFGAEELDLAEELGRVAALAVDNARLHQRAKAAIEARDDVIALVSHDLRNHLGAIEVAIEVLRDSGQAAGWDHEDRDMLEMAARASHRMNRLMADLLDVARAESGRLTLDRHPHDTGIILNAAEELLRPMATQKSVRIRRSRTNGTRMVIADFERILQVLENLGGNAIKFTEAGGDVILSVLDAGDEARFTVADTGPGIRPEHLPHLFDRFWQARTTARSGAGLGLAIAKGIVEAHGGRIWVESAVGAGSAFHFTLPVVGNP